MPQEAFLAQLDPHRCDGEQAGVFHFYVRLGLRFLGRIGCRAVFLGSVSRIVPSQYAYSPVLTQVVENGGHLTVVHELQVRLPNLQPVTD